MAFARSASRIDGLVRDIERARDQSGSAVLAVLLKKSVCESEMKALASLTGVTVVCGVQGAAGREQGMRQALPSVVLVRGGAQVLGLPELFRLHHGGARHLLERAGLGWRRRRLATYIAYRLARAGAVRLVVKLDELDSRIRRDGPVSHAAGRVLQGFRQLLLSARHRRSWRDLTAADLSGPSLLGPSEFHPRRVLMLNSALVWGGAERQVVNTMIGLHQRGWDVQLACENLGRVPDSEFFAPELDRYGLRYAALDDIGRAQVDWLAERDIRTQLEQRIGRLPPPFDAILWPYILALMEVRPGVVHAWQDQTSILAGVAAAIVGVPRIVLATRNLAPHHFAYHEPHMRAAYRVLSGLEQVRLLNNSHAGAVDYTRWLGVPDETFAVLHNGFDFDRFRSGAALVHEVEQAIPSEAPVVGSIFRFYAEKDPGLWMETARHIAIHRPDVHFLIIGTGPMREHVRNVAERYGLSDRVHLPGALREANVLLRRMSVFLLTSRFEGLPNVLIEAQAGGVPVVATSAGGSAETFIDGETGWLVGQRTPGALAARVLSVLEDRTWRERCRLLAPQVARERFGMDRMINETVALYGSASVPESRAASALH